MLLSCKISHSVISFLETRGEDLSPLLEASSLPEEFLRDTSYWMLAQEMEDFLLNTRRIYEPLRDHDLIEKIGQSVPELRAWGLLDSVLRMMPRPQEILAQPERFMSYFISPQPPVANLLRGPEHLEFDLPLSSEQYPLVVQYLRSAFQTLPVFVGREPAVCTWEGIHLKIQWEVGQESMFQAEDIGHQISPELLRNVVAALESAQRELEELKTQKQDRQAEWGNLATRQQLRHHLAKLGDYLVRAQQVITLALSQEKSSSGLREALRRVDWDKVVQQYPVTLEECQRLIKEPLASSAPAAVTAAIPVATAELEIDQNSDSRKQPTEQEFSSSIFNFEASPSKASAQAKTNLLESHHQEVFRV